MLDLEQHSTSDKSSSHHSTDAARYWQDFPNHAAKQAVAYAKRARLPGSWFTFRQTEEVLKWARAHHVGNASGVSSIEMGMAFGFSCCINHETWGNLFLDDFRQLLHHKAHKAWSQVTRIIDRLFACDMIRRVPGAEYVIQFRLYNDRALKRQKMQAKKHALPVTQSNNQVAYSSINSDTCVEPNLLLNADDAQADQVEEAVCDVAPWDVCFPPEFTKTPPQFSQASSVETKDAYVMNRRQYPSEQDHKKAEQRRKLLENIEKDREEMRKYLDETPEGRAIADTQIQHAPSDGIGPSILPVANQGLESSPKAKHAVIISEPLTALPSPKIEKAPESALRASFARLPFLDDTQALLERIRARDAEDVAFDVYTPSQSEAASRGFSVVNQEQERKRAEAYRPKAKLVPVRETAASFCFAPTQGRQRLDAGQSSAHDRARRREPT
ncbi:MAG: hypothetical protein EOO38_00145 [Cytophagaceae bacterium]|nr:MAG: hypothetical protein EOO38_00145 [Cytophagaceae bacterium]